MLVDASCWLVCRAVDLYAKASLSSWIFIVYIYLLNSIDYCSGQLNIDWSAGSNKSCSRYANAFIVSVHVLVLGGLFSGEVSLIMLSLSEGQPESIVQDIESMVRSYVDKVWMMYISLELTMTLTYFAWCFLN